MGWQAWQLLLFLSASCWFDCILARVIETSDQQRCLLLFVSYSGHPKQLMNYEVSQTNSDIWVIPTAGMNSLKITFMTSSGHPMDGLFWSLPHDSWRAGNLHKGFIRADGSKEYEGRSDSLVKDVDPFFIAVKFICVLWLGKWIWIFVFGFGVNINPLVFGSAEVGALPLTGFVRYLQVQLE